MRVEGIGKPEGCKLIRIKAELEKGVIQSIQIRGDFFASPEEEFDKIEQALEGVKINDAATAFDSFILRNSIEISGINGVGLAEVLNVSMGEGAGHG